MVLPVVFLTGGLPTKLPSWEVLAAVGTLGLVGTAIAYLLFFWLNTNEGPTRASIVTYLLPCTAILYGLLRNEPITIAKIGGLALVLFGMLIITGAIRLPRRAQRRPEHETAGMAPLAHSTAELEAVGVGR